MFWPPPESNHGASSEVRASWPLRIALVLALGGSCWGVFLLAVFGPAALLPLPFGVGYLVTVGYWVRTVSVPALAVRQSIWVASFAVQGCWLLFVGFPDLPRTGPNLFFLWWAFATVCSVGALVTEPGVKAGRTRRCTGPL